MNEHYKVHAAEFLAKEPLQHEPTSKLDKANTNIHWYTQVGWWKTRSVPSLKSERDKQQSMLATAEIEFVPARDDPETKRPSTAKSARWKGTGAQRLVARVLRHRERG